MERDQPQRETLAFLKPNTARVVKQLDDLIGEWRSWEKEVDKLSKYPDNLFDQKPFNILADAEENIKKKRIIQEKTLVFLENNIAGHGFIIGRDGSRIDRTDLPLQFRVEASHG
jgi:hypothetical protein